MTRYTRLQAPFTIHHIIGRFVNKEFRLNEPEERAEYLRRLGKALELCDWDVFAYALMSNHVHLVCRAGTWPSERLIKSTHVGFAHWLNARQSRFGPLFAERHTTVLVPDERAGQVIAYDHNNVVRARVVSNPLASTWTSHAAYVGEAEPPPWLNVEEGLRLAGFGTSALQRAEFHKMVLDRRADPRNPGFSEDSKEQRKAVRRVVGSSAEVTSPLLTTNEATPRSVDVRTRPGAALRANWDGPVDAVIDLVAAHLDVPTKELPSTSRERDVVAARRLALLVWTAHLSRPACEMASALGLSSGAASHLLNRDSEAVAKLGHDSELIAARVLAPRPRQGDESKKVRTVPDEEARK